MVGRCFFTFLDAGVGVGVGEAAGALATASGALICAVTGFSCLLEQLITTKANAPMVEAAITSGRCRRSQLTVFEDPD